MKTKPAFDIGKTVRRTVVRLLGATLVAPTLVALLLATLVILTPMSAWSTTFLERAQQYFDEGDLNAAEVELKNALQRDPDNAEARFLRGKVLLKLGDAKTAERELLRAKDLGYGGEEFELMLATARLKLRQFSDVTSGIPDDIAIESAVQRDLYVARGEALMGLGNFDEAQAIFDRVLQDGPHGAALANKARIAGMLGNMTEARDLLDRALAADPDSDVVATTDAAWLLRNSEFEAAKAGYARAIQLDPTDLISHIGLIRSHIALGELTEADRVLKLLKERQPDNLLIVLQESVVLFFQHQYQAAKNAAERVLAINSNQPQAVLISGYSSYQLQEFEQAKKYLSIYLAQRPQDDEVRAVLGATLLKLGYRDEAFSLMTEPGEDVPDTTAYLSVLTSAAAGVNDQVATLRYLRQLAAKVPDNDQVQERLGLALIAAGEVDQAIDVLNRTLQLNPRSEKALLHLYGVFLQRANFPKALQLSKKMQEEFPNKSIGYTLEGAIRINEGDGAEAEAALRNALEVQPTDTAAVRNLAQLLLAENRIDDALNVFNSALELAPDAWPLLLNFASLQRKIGEEAKAQELLRQVLEINPEAGEARALLANSLLQTGDVDEAVEVGQSALQDNPNNPSLVKTVGLALIQGGSPAEALDLLDRLAAAAPTDARAHEYRSLALEQLGRIKEAETALEAAAEIEPENNDVRLARAALLLKLGDLDESKKIVSALKQTMPDDARLLVVEGRIALREGAPERAATAFEAALAKTEDNLVLLDLVQAKFEAGKSNEGFALMTNWLAEHSEDVAVRHRQAEYLMAFRRWTEAQVSYDSILAHQPNDARALNNLAWVKIELGEAEDAVDSARRASKLAPENVNVTDTLAMALLHAGQEQESIDLLQSAARSFPENRTLRYHLAQAYGAAGLRDEAVNELREILSDSVPFRERNDAEALLASLMQ